MELASAIPTGSIALPCREAVVRFGTDDLPLETGTPASVALACPDPARFHRKEGERVEPMIERIGSRYNPTTAHIHYVLEREPRAATC